MNCIQIILVVAYVFAVLKTIRLAAKCSDKACQNLKDGTTDYRREVFNDPDRFTEKGLRFRKLSIRYSVLSLILGVGAVLLILIFGPRSK